MKGTAMIKIAVCDDDPQALARIDELIACQQEIILPETRFFLTGEELISAISEDGYLPDVAVLDIVLPHDSGIDLAKKLNLICPGCSIIFLSAHLSFAPEVYETRHSYFVLKTQAAQRMGAALKKALAEKACREFISIRYNGQQQLLPVDEVLYMERRLKKTLLVQASGNEYLVTAKPAELLSELKNSPFIRCHQSFWVNLEYIGKMSAESFLLTSGQEIPISRSFRADAKAAFHRFLCHSALSHEL